MVPRKQTRREALAVLGIAPVAALAGCLGGDDGDDDNNNTGGDGGNGDDGGNGNGGNGDDGGNGNGGNGDDGGNGGNGDDGGNGNGGNETGAVRVAHVSPDAPAVDVYVDSDNPTLEEVAFGDVSDYLDVPAGDRTVEVTPAGEPDTEVFSGEVAVAANTDQTVAAVGEISDEGEEPFDLLALEDDNSYVNIVTSRLRVVHASPDAPAVDVTAGDGDVVLFDGVGYRESGTSEIDEGEYTVEIRGDTDGNNGSVVAEFDVTLEGGSVTTAFAAGYLSPEEAPADTAFDLILATGR